MSAPGQELVVLLDEAGEAVGTTAKSGVHHADTPLHLAFSCYVFDDEGRVLVTQRALHKPTWPGEWTNSFCGHPGPGETPADAVRRRAPQEIGVGVSDVRLALPAFRYRAVMANGVVENEMCPVYTAVATGPVVPDPAEVEQAVWEPWAEFRRGVLDGTRAISPWCRDQVAQLPEDPRSAPAADPAVLPPAARHPRSHQETP
ncbi:isopentenyl-diphosphate Delta-isomerase [uncultured Nocardioides sp.]|uniref:isopentenyl-diphosphate Delta-isomerase n=1 Tax=uncultured Nocardioides sp. TaxID=198441 RepID=UPI002627C800|nr:isopentenyl-diphosphate Delta-isomerase [uncultured Nocardioides sp.]